MKSNIIKSYMQWACLIITLAAYDISAETMFKCAAADGSINYQTSKCTGMKELATKSLLNNGNAPISDTSGIVSVLAAPNGAYYTDVSVNGTAMTMQVDTGATSVALSMSMAKSLRLTCGEAQIMKTASDLIMACRTQIKTLQIGSITLRNVDAVLVPNLTSGPLLGQTALKRLMVAQSNGTITLRSMR